MTKQTLQTRKAICVSSLDCGSPKKETLGVTSIYPRSTSIQIGEHQRSRTGPIHFDPGRKRGIFSTTRSTTNPYTK